MAVIRMRFKTPDTGEYEAGVARWQLRKLPGVTGANAPVAGQDAIITQGVEYPVPASGADITTRPTDFGWYYHVEGTTDSGWKFHTNVYVPDDNAYDLEELITLDPSSPFSSARPEPMWWSVVNQLSDYYQTGVTEATERAESAAESAESARGQANSARDGAVSARNTATQAAESAEDSAAEAGTYKSELEETFLGGTEAVNDAAVKIYVGTPGTQTKTALDTSIGEYAELFFPTRYCNLRWRQIRADVVAGRRQGHIALLGDSNGLGSDTTNPLYQRNYIGRVRDSLDQQHGSAGTGLIPMAHAFAPPSAVDPRFSAGGATFFPSNGMHRTGQWYFTDPDGNNYLDFTPDKNVTEFVVYTFTQPGGIITAAVDGSTVGTMRNISTGGTAPSIEPESGYSVGENGTRLLAHRIQAGADGQHTLRLTWSRGQRIGPIFMEGRSGGLGTFRVSNVSQAGKSFQTFNSPSYNDEVNGLFGLPMVDAIRADLLIIALGNNDFNGEIPVATTKQLLVDVIRRQRATGNNALGGQHAAGDVLLLRNPRNASGDDTFYAEYQDMFRQVAIEENVPLLNMANRWGGYSTANSMGLFANGSHFNEQGHRDVASAVLTAILA